MLTPVLVSVSVLVPVETVALDALKELGPVAEPLATDFEAELA